MINESNTCVLALSAALSSGVFPARNFASGQMIHRRKIPPSARFSLPGTVFHRYGQSGNRKTQALLKNPGGRTIFFALMNLIVAIPFFAKK